jgi:hypothetical protein
VYFISLKSWALTLLGIKYDAHVQTPSILPNSTRLVSGDLRARISTLCRHLKSTTSTCRHTNPHQPQFHGNGSGNITPASLPLTVPLRVVSRARSDYPRCIYFGVDTLRIQFFTILGTANPTKTRRTVNFLHESIGGRVQAV